MVLAETQTAKTAFGIGGHARRCAQEVRAVHAELAILVQPPAVGTIVVDREGYEVYDLKGTKTASVLAKAEASASSADTVGADSMTDRHFANFIAGIQKGEKLNAPIEVGNVAVTMLQLSNVAWKLDRGLNIDTANGKILKDAEAMKYWDREYEKGWAPKV